MKKDHFLANVGEIAVKQKLNLDTLLAVFILAAVPFVGMLVFASEAVPKSTGH